MTITLQIKGLDKLQNGLKSLPKKVAQRVLGDALRKGAYHLRDQIKARTPVRTGALREAIQAKSKKLSEVEYQAIVSPYLSGGTRPVFYAHLVEFGGRYVIKAKGSKKRGKPRIVATGRIGAQPFMRPTFDTEKVNIINMIAEKLGQGVAREFKRLGGPGNG